MFWIWSFTKSCIVYFANVGKHEAFLKESETVKETNDRFEMCTTQVYSMVMKWSTLGTWWKSACNITYYSSWLSTEKTTLFIFFARWVQFDSVV